MDIRQTKEYAQYLKQTGWVVERIGDVNYFIRKFPIFGSIIKVQRPQQLNNETIEQLSKKYRALQIIVEPLSTVTSKQLSVNGFKLSNSPFLPTKTLHLDLTKSKEQLLDQMKNDARAAVGRNSELPISNYKLRDLDKFRKSWTKAVGWKRYVPPLKNLIALKKSFGTNSLFIASENSNSGAIFLIGDRTAYYWQAFTNKIGRKNLEQYKIVWEGILWAKKKGVKVFDFEGIYDERFPNKSWLGFTHFKKSFGGKVVEYPGAFVKTKLPF